MNTSIVAAASGVSILRLTGGIQVTAPSNIQILNREEEGRRRNLFIILVFDENNVKESLSLLANEDAKERYRPYGWFSDNSAHGDFSNFVTPDQTEMIGRLIREVRRSKLPFTNWSAMIARLDPYFRETQLRRLPFSFAEGGASHE